MGLTSRFPETWCADAFHFEMTCSSSHRWGQVIVSWHITTLYNRVLNNKSANEPWKFGQEMCALGALKMPVSAVLQGIGFVSGTRPLNTFPNIIISMFTEIFYGWVNKYLI